MDAMEILAKYAVETNYEDLPSEVVKRMKYFVLDSFGVAIAGTTSPGTKEVINLVEEWGGKGESTVWMYGNKIPSFHAAFANSVLIHSRELDDTHDTVRGHYNVSILPASFAVAEAKQKVSGKELLAALVLGMDLMFRVNIGMQDYYGWHFTSTLGTFGSATGAGKILKLNVREMLNCLGIAYSQLAGNEQCVIDGSLVKRIQPGFSSMAGVRSAYLASKGIDGPTHILEGKDGYYNVYGRGKYQREEIIKGLGERFAVMSLSFKPFPCCRYTHAPIGAALDLIDAQGINPSEIEEVLLKVTQCTKHFVGRPFEIGPNPEVSAQFSIPYVVATALLKRDVFIDDFMNSSIQNPQVQALAKKIKVEVDESFENQVLSLPIIMIIKLKNGRTFRKEVKAIKGSPSDPLSESELINKFNKCMGYSLKPFSRAKIDRIIDLCLNLEEIENISVFTEALIA